jgi:hypothetical protein
VRHLGDLDAWLAERRRHTRLIASLSEGPRVPRRKPRSPEQNAVLEHAALAAIAAREAEGRLVRIGPRRYRVVT